MEKEPLIINTKMRMDRNPIGITPGTMIDINIQIIDEYAFISTSIPKFTKELVKTADKGEIAAFNEKSNKTIFRYPGLSQRQIFDKVTLDLSKLPRG